MHAAAVLPGFTGEEVDDGFRDAPSSEPVSLATGPFTWSELMGFLLAYYRIYANIESTTGNPWTLAKEHPVTRPLLLRRSREQLKDKRKNMESSPQVSSGGDELVDGGSHESSCVPCVRVIASSSCPKNWAVDRQRQRPPIGQWRTLRRSSGTWRVSMQKYVNILERSPRRSPGEVYFFTPPSSTLP